MNVLKKFVHAQLAILPSAVTIAAAMGLMFNSIEAFVFTCVSAQIVTAVGIAAMLRMMR